MEMNMQVLILINRLFGCPIFFCLCLAAANANTNTEYKYRYKYRIQIPIQIQNTNTEYKYRIQNTEYRIQPRQQIRTRGDKPARLRFCTNTETAMLSR